MSFAEMKLEARIEMLERRLIRLEKRLPPPPNPSPVSKEKPEHEQHHKQAPDPARAITPATGPRNGGGDEQGEHDKQNQESEQGSTSLSHGNVVTDGEDA